MLPRPVTWLLALLAAVVLPLAVLSAWTAAMVEDTDTWVEDVAPLAEDPVVTEQVASRLAAASLAALGSPYADRPRVQVAVRQSVARVVGGPEFPPAWVAANRVLHRELVRVLSGDRLPAGEPLRIDLAPLAGKVVDGLRAEGVATQVDLSGRAMTVEVVATEELERARWAWRLVTTLGYWLPITWVALVALVLSTARRRLAALGELAAASLLGLGLLWVGLAAARTAVLEQAPPIAEPMWDTVTSSLLDTIQVGMVVAVVALALRVAIGLGRGPRNT